MSKYLQRRIALIEKLKSLGIRNELVLNAITKVPRHLFIEEALRTRAYDNIPLPIGYSQTISQPYIVARMSELLINKRTTPLNKVLEIGTGCGYQTAILENLNIPKIFSIERINSLRELAKENLKASGCINSRLKCADGYLGLPTEAPFDGIIVTAAPPNIPIELLNQLALNGRLVIPLMEDDNQQYLWLIEKLKNGFKETCITEVKFVPLLSGCI